MFRDWERGLEKLAEGGGSQPSDVAAAIIEAIETGDKFRYPVGPDANMVVTALKSLTFEQFEQAMRQQLGLTW